MTLTDTASAQYDSHLHNFIFQNRISCNIMSSVKQENHNTIFKLEPIVNWRFLPVSLFCLIFQFIDLLNGIEKCWLVNSHFLTILKHNAVAWKYKNRVGVNQMLALKEYVNNSSANFSLYSVATKISVNLNDIECINNFPQVKDLLVQYYDEDVEFTSSIDPDIRLNFNLLSQLQTFTLNTNMQNIPYPIYKSLIYMNNLTSLQLIGSSFERETLKHLSEAVTSMKKLQSLNLSYMYVHNSFFHNLECLKILDEEFLVSLAPTITSFIMKDMRAFSFSVTNYILGTIAKFNRLTELDISENSFSSLALNNLFSNFSKFNVLETFTITFRDIYFPLGSQRNQYSQVLKDLMISFRGAITTNIIPTLRILDFTDIFAEAWPKAQSEIICQTKTLQLVSSTTRQNPDLFTFPMLHTLQYSNLKELGLELSYPVQERTEMFIEIQQFLKKSSTIENLQVLNLILRSSFKPGTNFGQDISNLKYLSHFSLSGYNLELDDSDYDLFRKFPSKSTSPFLEELGFEACFLDDSRFLAFEASLFQYITKNNTTTHNKNNLRNISLCDNQISEQTMEKFKSRLKQHQFNFNYLVVVK